MTVKMLGSVETLSTAGYKRSRERVNGSPLLLSRQRSRSRGGGATIRDIAPRRHALTSSCDMNVVKMSGPRERRVM